MRFRAGRTGGWSRDYYVTTKISWLDSNGAPLVSYARGLQQRGNWKLCAEGQL